jgi:orotidine-5'-phosphate decarboxylase
MRLHMPAAVFLLPGVGAQGGRVEDLGAAFAPGRAAALVTASRSIVGPAVESGDPGVASRLAEQLREATWSASG